MNKKGFTLVELLGVLVLVAVILIVVVTPIVGQINSKKGEIDEATKMVLFSSATSYLDNYQTLYPKGDGNIYYISLERMMNAGELSKEYIDGKNLTKETAIKVTVEDGGYQYSIIQNIDNEIVSGEPVYSSLGKKTKELLDSSATVEYLEGIAKTSPKAFKSMFGIKETVSFVSVNFLQSARHVTQTDEAKEEINTAMKNAKDPRQMAELFNKLAKDPSLLNNINTW